MSGFLSEFCGSNSLVTIKAAITTYMSVFFPRVPQLYYVLMFITSYYFFDNTCTVEKKSEEEGKDREQARSS